MNTHVAEYKKIRHEETMRVRRRAAHTITYVETKGKTKLVCSCGGQSKLGSTDVNHQVILL